MLEKILDKVGKIVLITELAIFPYGCKGNNLNTDYKKEQTQQIKIEQNQEKEEKEIIKVIETYASARKKQDHSEISKVWSSRLEPVYYYLMIPDKDKSTLKYNYKVEKILSINFTAEDYADCFLKTFPEGTRFVNVRLQSIDDVNTCYAAIANRLIESYALIKEKGKGKWLIGSIDTLSHEKIGY